MKVTFHIYECFTVHNKERHVDYDQSFLGEMMLVGGLVNGYGSPGLCMHDTSDDSRSKSTRAFKSRDEGKNKSTIWSRNCGPSSQHSVAKALEMLLFPSTSPAFSLSKVFIFMSRKV